MDLVIYKNSEKLKKISIGWMPTRRIHDVILGLDQLFTDLIDFDDPLNAQASQQWQSNKVFSFF